MVTEMLVEPANSGIVLTNKELHFPHPPAKQPTFGSLHDRSPESDSLKLRVGSDVVDPAAMPVFANHRGGNNSSSPFSHQNSRMLPAPGELNVSARIVPS